MWGTIDDRLDDDEPLRGAAPLRGPAARWVDVLSDRARELRFDSFVFWPEDPSREQVERFGRDVAPAVRERVGRG